MATATTDKRAHKPFGSPASAADAVYGCIARASSEEELLAEIAATIAKAASADSCDILLVKEGWALELRASTSIPEYTGRLRMGKGVGVAGYTLECGRPVAISRNLLKHRKYAVFVGVAEPDYQSSFSVPIFEKGHISGVVMLRKLVAWRISSAERKKFIAMADAVVPSVIAYRNAYDAGRRSSKLGALSELTQTVSASPYLEEILQLLVNLTAQRFNFKVVTVRLLDRASQELILRATQAENRAYQRKRAIKLGESHAGRAIVENKTIIVDDVQVDQDYIGHDLAEEQGLRSMICVPLAIQDRPVGVLTCYTDEVRAFDLDEVSNLEILAKQAAISIEHAKLHVRNTLMQEMHHRVKNNLQQVASILRLQLRSAHYSSLDHALNDSLARILAIAAVHDLLSREDLDHVSLKSIAEALVQHQQQSFMLPEKRITFSIRGDEVVLTMSQATQVALILNELIQNAVEHGFVTKDEGQIHINVEERAGEVGLWVSNDGDQLPAGFDTKQGQLGLQIVDNLSRSLGGSFVLEDRLGWTVSQVKFTRTGGE